MIIITDNNNKMLFFAIVIFIILQALHYFKAIVKENQRKKISKVIFHIKPIPSHP